MIVGAPEFFISNFIAGTSEIYFGDFLSYFYEIVDYATMTPPDFKVSDIFKSAFFTISPPFSRILV